MTDQASAAFSNAAIQILKAFGREKVGEIVRRSAAVIYKWSDSRLHYYPNLYQALELDAAFTNFGFGDPPFLTAYTNLIRQRILENGQENTEILPDAIRIVELACTIVTQASAHLASGTSGHHADSRQRDSILQNLHRLGELQAALVWRLESAEQQMPAKPQNARNGSAID